MSMSEKSFYNDWQAKIKVTINILSCLMSNDSKMKLTPDFAYGRIS